jgi:hypothetical protein
MSIDGNPKRVSCDDDTCCCFIEPVLAKLPFYPDFPHWMSPDGKI